MRKTRPVVGKSVATDLHGAEPGYGPDFHAASCSRISLRSDDSGSSAIRGLVANRFNHVVGRLAAPALPRVRPGDGFVRCNLCRNQGIPIPSPPGIVPQPFEKAAGPARTRTSNQVATGLFIGGNGPWLWILRRGPLTTRNGLSVRLQSVHSLRAFAMQQG
jgi:hypothetical protein